MDGNIETAAKKFGVYLIVSTVIFIIGLHFSLNANTTQLGRHIQRAGVESRSNIGGFPSSLKLNLYPKSPFRDDLIQSDNRDLRIAPIKVEVEAKTVD